MLARGLLRREVGEDALREHLAELHAPLVVAVDVPDDTLDEDLVLVERDERAEGLGRELIAEERVRGLVALEGLERDELLVDALGRAFLGRLAERERLGLGEEVRHQLVVEVADRVVRLRAADEVARDEVRALVDELVERVLAVRAGFAPLDRTRRVVDRIALLVDALAVRLHVHLLEIGREAREVLVVREDAVGFGAVAVVVEDAEEREDDRHVALEAGRAEVTVHLVVALEQLLVVVAADREHERKTDRGRKRVAAADPIPEDEHVLRVDAERGDFLRGRGDGDEVLGDGGFRGGLLEARLLGLSEEPLLRRKRVGHRLLRREGLGRDDEQGLVRLHRAERLGEVRRVDVGDEEELHVALRVGRERDVRHDGTEIGAADADVDDVLDALAGEALPLALTDLVGERGHLVEDLAHARHDVLAVNLDLDVLVLAAKRGVKNGATLGRVDLLAGEHLLDLFLEVCLLRELDERLHRRLVDAVLGVVEEPARGLERELRRAILVFREEILDRLRLVLVYEFIDLFPSLSVHCHFPR